MKEKSKMSEQYAKVVIDLPVKSVDRVFHYRVPEYLRPKAQIGMRVQVPFGRRKVTGYLVGFTGEPEVREVKEIIALLDEQPLFGGNMLALAEWMAAYYLCTLAEVLQCILPTGIKQNTLQLVQLAPAGKMQATTPELSPPAAKVCNLLRECGEMELNELKKIIGRHNYNPILQELQAQGLITVTVAANKAKVGTKYAKVLRLAKPVAEINALLAGMRKRAPKQAAILELLLAKDGYTVTELAKAAGAANSTVHALITKGILRQEKVVLRRDPYAEREFKLTEPLPPTPEQARALQIITASLNERQPKPILLHGITGSGKTEIYLQAIAQTLAQGREAIVLVPEISLTPQMIERFKARFGSTVAVLHSRLSLGERYDEWCRIRSGAAKIAIGARSAVFAPFAKLGLIVMDEEHETSYKQDFNPRYHTREVALRLAQMSGALLLLGSATPSLESYRRAQEGTYRLIELTQRIDNAALPPVTIVDLREEMKNGNKSIFSRKLQQAIAERLAHGEQTILFLNRRGYATFVLCRECGLVLRCLYCDVALTYHLDQQVLQCHYCNYTARMPQNCPRCKSKYIRRFGIGTQKVEEEVKRIFPQARVLRMDIDTTGRKGMHEQILRTFGEHKADILIGTQMIAKGLDFPHVTLVGVITADTTLNLPDFRAGERTFQLLTQVAGRAGRGKQPGEVIIQTYAPQHYSVVTASRHDYHAFYEAEIAERASFNYPPFSHFIRIVITAPVEQHTIDTAQTLGSLFCALTEGTAIEVLGPTPAALAKVKNKYRWQLVLKGSTLELLRKLVREALKRLEAQAKPKAEITIDVNPLSML